MTADLSDADRGTEVVNGTERIGTITDVRGERVYVDPNWDNVDEGIAETLDWDEEDESQWIDQSAFTAVRNNQARLRDDLF